MLLMSRYPKIVENYRKKRTGQLSFVTNFLTLAGSTARVFTILQEIGTDYALLLPCVLNAITSAILVLQVLR